MNEQSPSTLVETLSIELNADVLLYVGGLGAPHDHQLVTACTDRSKRQNVLLVLVTYGGDPDAAYRIARCLQQSYDRFIVFVPEFCKSAGTLLALGADEVIVSVHGEIGPLDLQYDKKDDLVTSQSVFATSTVMSELQAQTIQTFEQVFLNLNFRSGNRIALSTAMDVASKLATDLFAPLLAKLDPIDVGERARESAVAREYGERLLEHSKNMDLDTLTTLIQGYPSHGFVIDREEAKQLFTNCRDSTELEASLAASVWDLTRRWHTDSKRFEFLSNPVDDSRGDEDESPEH